MYVGAPFTILLAAAALAGAAALHLGASPHRDRASTLLEDARSEGSAYVATFDGAHLDAQLDHFRERRAAIAQASRWILARDLSVLLAGGLLAAAWVQAFLRRLDALRADAVQPPARPATSRTVPVAAR